MAFSVDDEVQAKKDLTFGTKEIKKGTEGKVKQVVKLENNIAHYKVNFEGDGTNERNVLEKNLEAV